METAFVLGAGLGTRLRPLTNILPKPLVPVLNRPLITHAFDHLRTIGVQRIVVNTHHLPDSYDQSFPGGSYRNLPIEFRNEQILLDTGGGVSNVSDLAGDEGLVVYNGDILADFPLAPALEFHRSSDFDATLVLRSNHPDKRIAFDPSTHGIVDIKDQLGTGAPREYGFTGIYFLNPPFLSSLPSPHPFSIIPHFLKWIENGSRVGGFVAEEGRWFDLGSHEAYLNAHCSLTQKPVVHPKAKVHPEAQISGATCIGAGATVGAGASLKSTIVWDGCTVTPGAHLDRRVVYPSSTPGESLVSEEL